MNVYLIEDGDGVTVFDCGISDMAAPLAAAGARLGGIKRVVLGHADADHRGAAPALDAPVYCHPAECAAAESAASYRDYWDRAKLDPRGRTVLWRLLATWDGGAVPIAGTLDEGDEVAGFSVVHLPGHAPGLIGLFRDSDRLALVSDSLYTLDPQSGRRQAAHVPHPAFNQDTEQARASIRKLAALDPATVWAGHADPVTGDVGAQLSAPPTRRRHRPTVAKRDRKRREARRPDQRVPRRRWQRAALRGSLPPGSRRSYAETLAGGLEREDAWQRATEFLFERLAVSWTIAGLEITRQKELLGRYRMASGDERQFVRDSLREHVAEHFPELEAP